MSKHQVISFEFRKMTNIIGRQIGKRMMEQGFDEVTIMHGHILGYLYQNRDRDIYQKDIAATFEIGKSTVTNILPLMEKKGYLMCVPDKNDGRLKKIELTQKGIDTQHRTMQIIDKLHEDLEEGITDEEKEVFFRIIEKMKKNSSK